MNETKKIYQELCEFEPEFKKYEEVLLRVIDELLAAKPDTKFDPEFARVLKAKIMAMPNPKKNFNFMNWKYLVPVGAAFAVVVLAVALQIQNPNNGSNRMTQLALGGESITRMNSHAFGSLGRSSTDTSGPIEKNSVAPMAYGRGGGGGGVAVSNGPTASAMMAPDQSAGKMMIYRPQTFKYVYKGDVLELKDKTVDVLQRIKPSIDTSAAVGVLKGYSVGGVDLGSFPGGQVTSYEIAQSNDGYTINVNLRDGNVSINRNYETQPCVYKGVCPQIQPLRPSDFPSDEEVIAASNKFLKDHGVDPAKYDTPVVQNDWRKNVEGSGSTMPAYIPDYLQVQYPTKIQNTPVTDQAGNPNGLSLNYDVRKKSVAGVWNIQTENYQSSAYDAETDWKRIVGIAENGGIYGNGYQDPGAEVVEIDLGTPTRIYTNIWKNDGTGEVLVPALSFPVIKVPEGKYYYNKAIVVPLAKELLQTPEPGPVRIMNGVVPPVSKDAASGSVEGSAGSSVEPTPPSVKTF